MHQVLLFKQFCAFEVRAVGLWLARRVYGGDIQGRSAVTRVTRHHITSHSFYAHTSPTHSLRHTFSTGPSPEDLAFVQQALQKQGGPTIPPSAFAQTAPPYDPQLHRGKRGNMPRVDLQNPQTLGLMQLLGLR